MTDNDAARQAFHALLEGSATDAATGLDDWQHMYDPLYVVYKERGVEAVRMAVAADKTLTKLIASGLNTEYVTDWQKDVISAHELKRKEFDPLTWVVDRILPEGACLLAGKPKSRKSWLALAISVAVASGGKALGHLNVTPGRVLFLDLESNQRRMQARLRALMERGPWPENLHIATEWPRGADGLKQLDAWMETHPDTRLIVIDVMADFRRPQEAKEQPYIYDRETVKPINEWAEKHRVTVLLIHHTRKAKADDVFDEISGSTGLPSAVATMWVIGRSPERSDEYIFAMRGRDLEDDEPLALKWDAYTNSHVVLGDASQYAVTAERRQIIDLLQDGNEWTPKEIAEELQKSAPAVKKLLPSLVSSGVVEKVGHGRYALVERRDDGGGGFQPVEGF